MNISNATADTTSVAAPLHAVAAEAISAAPRPKKAPYLLGPTADVLIIGGASLVMAALSWLVVDRSANTSQISWTAFYLAFIINNPHFMASYVLLYWDKRKELLRKPAFLWAAVIAPALIVALLAVGIFAASTTLLGYAVNIMFFTVGWHYIKQIYGTIIVTSVRRGYYLTKIEGQVLKANLFPVWFMSYINGNQAVREQMQYGIGYKTFSIPSWLLDLNYGVLVISLIAVFVMVARKYVREGKLPGLAAVASFAAIYCWYLPQLYHAHFWYMIPFFHSFQYMLFVATIKKNQYAAEAKEVAKGDSVKERLVYLKKYGGFIAVIGVTAALTFKMLPNFLDGNVVYDHKLFGTELFMFCFITFINIHHYFIDNVIWKKDNDLVKKYLT